MYLAPCKCGNISVFYVKQVDSTSGSCLRMYESLETTYEIVS
jgi:hypothetical protein